MSKIDIVIREEPVADDDMVCPYCGTEDIQMIGDPEYNDLWGCNNDHEFGSWVERKDFEASPSDSLNKMEEK